MTSTWVSCDRQGELHTRRKWRKRGVKKHIDYIMGPRDLLNKGRLGAWDHYPVVVKVEGKELKLVQGENGWAGWVSNTEEERRKLKTQVFCPEGSQA